MDGGVVVVDVLVVVDVVAGALVVGAVVDVVAGAVVGVVVDVPAFDSEHAASTIATMAVAAAAFPISYVPSTARKGNGPGVVAVTSRPSSAEWRWRVRRGYGCWDRCGAGIC